jgi:hypothetical protein
MPIVNNQNVVTQEDEILYHYTDSKSLLNIIKSQQLQCTKYNYFYTEQDDIHFRNLLNRVLASDEVCHYIFSTLFNPNLLDMHLCRFNYFIGSFSKLKAQDKIWERWPEGDSLSIGINIDNLIDINWSNTRKLNKVDVIYDDEDKIKRLSDFILKQDISKYQELEQAEAENNPSDKLDLNKYYENERFKICEEFSKGLFLLSLQMKRDSLKDEEEVLLVVKEPVQDSETRNYKTNRVGNLVEYINLKLCLEKNLEEYSLNPANSDKQNFWINSFFVGYDFPYDNHFFRARFLLGEKIHNKH